LRADALFDFDKPLTDVDTFIQKIQIWQLSAKNKGANKL